MTTERILSESELLQLQRWNTPTIYNGWEQLTSQDPARDAFNMEETHDFMPEMGPMVGYAVTCVIEPSKKQHKVDDPQASEQYHAYVASVPGPKIVVVQDLDKPVTYGSMWGEVKSSIHRAQGCVGAIVDGAVRDLDEMKAAGFKALARRLCVGHAHAWPVRWNTPVEVFGRRIEPGQLIHADKHGFIAIPPGEEASLLEASIAMDTFECNHLINVARNSAGKSSEQLLAELERGAASFSADVLKMRQRLKS